MDVNRNCEEVTISYDEYETMAKRVIDSEDLAQKRIAAAIAQVYSKYISLNINNVFKFLKFCVYVNHFHKYDYDIHTLREICVAKIIYSR